ncbi:MAG: 50S ribosome-binding GTPase [Endomicrobia bacterium]|nr:50S ribosome-binding GTPase [Endomicrobiia bacterium]
MLEYTSESIEMAVIEALDEQKIPSIFLCSKTGNGKSSVINFLFNEKVSNTNNFEPCTRGIKLHKSNYINIYDSEGYEIGEKSQTYYKNLLDEFFAKNKNNVDLVWYAISGADKNYTDADINIIKNVEAMGLLCVGC